MKYLGIDYGTKKIGLAISDDGGSIAFPKSIIPNNTNLFQKILEIIKQDSIQHIVVGYSPTQSGDRNIISDDIDVFIESLTRLTNIPVHIQDERFSSSTITTFLRSKPVASPRRAEKSTKPIDDRAAAIMLQRFLDK